MSQRTLYSVSAVIGVIGLARFCSRFLARFPHEEPIEVAYSIVALLMDNVPQDNRQDDAESSQEQQPTVNVRHARPP